MLTIPRPFAALFEEEPVGPLLDLAGRFDPELQMWVSEAGTLMDVVPMTITGIYTCSGYIDSIDQGQPDKLCSEYTLDATQSDP